LHARRGSGAAMTYDDWKADAPDPGTVEDARCAICGANDDEPCEPDCSCSWCQREPRTDDGEQLTRSELDSLEREQMIDVYVRLK
jgi:hypothetical protein